MKFIGFKINTANLQRRISILCSIYRVKNAFSLIQKEKVIFATIMMVYLLFVIGFVCLIKGADWLVVGSATVAKKNNISDLVVGLTIVSMGTSMPELVVNLLASSKGASQIAIGNIIGSNIANILLILGVTSLIYPVEIKKSTLFYEIPYSIFALVIVVFVTNTTLFDSTKNTIGHFDGIILLLFFGLFVSYIIKLARAGRGELIDDIPATDLSNSKAAIFILLGTCGLFLGGQWVIEGAVAIATSIGLSETFVGLTIVAIGTSLPELVTSAVAAYRKNTDIAVANVIGSNIFNLLWVLGISAMIHPLQFDDLINTDMLILLGASCLIFISVVSKHPKNQIGKPTGALFMLSYVGYILFLVWRG